MISRIKLLFLLVFIGMTYEVVQTSLDSSLFVLIATWDSQNVMAPWFSASVWALGLVCLGSIATAAYVLVQLYRLEKGDGLDQLFLRRKTVQSR